MPSKLEMMLSHPIQAGTFIYVFLSRTLLVLLSRILLPTAPRYQTLRIELQRAYLTSASLCFPDLTFCLPTKYPESDALPVAGKGWTGYVVPGGRHPESVLEEVASVSEHRVVLFAHGGGYARGEARMYVPYMRRWVTGAKERGLKLVFLSVEYSAYTKVIPENQRI